jgi:Domain of unknown function (DUF4350)
MRDRLVTLLGALLALAIVYALFFQRPGEPPVTKPLSAEAGRNGYLGLWTWLEREHVRVVSLRDRYSTLREHASPSQRGNVLLVTMPFRTPLRRSEIEPLQAWLRDGNTVLVLAALDDSPDWLPLADQTDFRNDLAALTGLRFTTPSEEAAARAAEPRQPAPRRLPARPPIEARTAIEIEPAVEHPLLAGVSPLRGYSDDASEVWSAYKPDASGLVLRLATESSSGNDALWERPYGRGEIVVAASGSLLANRNVGEGGARELVRNLLRYRLGEGGAVIFDDMHQGLSSLYDAAALLRDPRLRYTIWFVLAAWLVYVLGASNRLAPPRTPRSVPRQGDFVAAAGGFMARRLERGAAGRLLLDEWLDEVRRARGLPRGTPLWAELERTPTLARGVYEELHGYEQALADGGAVDLVRLHNTLMKAREAIG